MLFAPAPSNPAFQPLLVQDPVLLRAGAVSDYPAWLSLRERSRAHLTEWEESWTPEQAMACGLPVPSDALEGAGEPRKLEWLLQIFRLADTANLGSVSEVQLRELMLYLNYEEREEKVRKLDAATTAGATVSRLR